MDVRQMRVRVQEAYSGQRWLDKVKKMPDDQIVALYFSLVKQGHIKGV